MVVECESSTDIEIIVGTYEEFVLGYKALKTEDGRLDLSQSFANHSHRASVRCVAAAGRFLASGGADDLIQLYDMKLRKEMGVLMHHDRTVTCLAFVNQTHLASGSDDGELALWRTGNWQCEKILTAHREGGICAVAVHPSGKLCLTAGKDRSLRTWNLVKGRPAYTTNLHAQAEALAWSPSGEHYAVVKLVHGGAQFSVDVYAVAVAGVVYSFRPEQRPAGVCFLQDDVVGVGTDGGRVELHSVSSKSLLTAFQAHSGRVRCLEAVRFSSGGMWLVTASSTGDIAVWKYQELDAESDSLQMTPPKQLGSMSAGCRITSMVLVVTPTGAAPCKLETNVDAAAVEEVKPVVAAPSKRKGRVIIELEESDEETAAPPAKKKGKVSEAVAKKGTVSATVGNKKKSGVPISLEEPTDEVVHKKKKKKAGIPVSTESTGKINKKKNKKLGVPVGSSNQPASKNNKPNEVTKKSGVQKYKKMMTKKLKHRK